MKLIVGLGNPGEEYRLTRHNVGFMVLEEFARSNDAKFRSNKRFKALTAELLLGNENCYIVMPKTFMNLSGHSVRLIVKWLKIELQNILLVMDDIALPLGVIRIRPKGSDAGHKGLRSVIDCLGASEFSRMKIGIMGRRNIKDLSGYVLDRFTRNEQKVLPEILNRATQACECWVRENVSMAMTRYNNKI
ncbi:MAG: aminoacyl-tRNA hydrolase [Candidatus Omnitrophica bacterium]|nr:aminoacyl-tRNA hydrolase [Candidatus Omnitrophota bacterium]MBU1853643.1 aminoacyl-tRNA hydrolase [Candidatus Omnitrophota bacterium]